MTIGSVNNGGNIRQVNNEIKANRKFHKEQEAANTNVASRKADKLELSGAAKRMQAIRAKIDQDFYDKPEVMKRTAEKLYKEDLQEEQATNN